MNSKFRPSKEIQNSLKQTQKFIYTLQIYIWNNFLTNKYFLIKFLYLIEFFDLFEISVMAAQNLDFILVVPT